MHRRFRKPGRIPVKQLEPTLNKSRRKTRLHIVNIRQEKRVKLELLQDTSVYKEMSTLPLQTLYM